ncbi:leucyl aminopeptidase [Salinarimonas ramus]|uniref:Probable cytosol aminopeptidase n=1 Tax=Salinarimonas ramus TaxID=690164 RepID=A0A917Q6V3_9HYPH|nr:leucyl aminopeptidase [Salinarimonas ramus]GGK32354.1 putative cytosol aminopeptidase [Salinarimonas ramus]
MAEPLKIDFISPALPDSGDLVVFVGDDLALGPVAAETLGEAASLVARAAKSEKFKGKWKSVMSIAQPAGLAVDRLVVVGIGGAKERAELDFALLGGVVAGRTAGRTATVICDLPEVAAGPEEVAEISLGARLRAYAFDRYKSKKGKKSKGEGKSESKADEKGGDDAEDMTGGRLSLACADPSATKKAAKIREGLAEGVTLARDLVNEPANVLGPVEFADMAKSLEKVGVEVEILDEKQLAKIGMRALLGVAQGSERPARVAIMRWNGGGKKDKPIAFIGKGVVFDTGGISIKPAGGMEDMKGDMAGAACVVGLMHALASRKAKANVIGAIGLVENMPDGRAQRPGDIVETLSGITVEVINTDAEGRLVLADVITYVRDRFEPAFMIDLATLTGAILVALGNEHAGLFSNDDTLAERLHAAGLATGEKVWRMPLGPAYDKMIESKVADIKNVGGGRNAGSITAAQFLKRFVEDTPWAHLDIAGTGMGAAQTEISRTFGSGYGVRLLDRLVRDHYEG